MADIQLLLEAEKRGLLPPDRLALLQEARTRGLIPQSEQPDDVPREAKPTEPLTTMEKVALGADKAVGALGDAAWKVAPKILRPFLPDRQNLVDVAAGATGLMRGGSDLISEGSGEKMWPTSAANEDSGMRTLGSLLDPVAAVTGTKAYQLGQLAPKVVFKGSNYLRKIVGGGAAGGAVGALSEDTDAGTGAAIGAGISAALPPLAWMGSKGVKLINNLIETIPGMEPKAGARLIKDVATAAGTDEKTIIKAMEQAKPGITAGQAGADVAPTEFAALDKLGRVVDPTPAEDMMVAQAAQQRADLAVGARGSSQTEAIQARRGMVDELRETVVPKMDIELEAANTAGKLVPKYRQVIEQKRLSNAGAMQNAGQMYSEFGNQTNQAWKTAGAPQKTRIPATERSPGDTAFKTTNGHPGLGAAGDVKINRNVDQAIKNYEGAADAAVIGKQRNAEKAFVENQLGSLEAHGLSPINTSKLVGGITRKLDNPSIGVSDINKRVLTRIGRKIQEWTDKGGGVIDVRALHEIRKNSVNEEVERLMRGSDPSAQARRAAGILKEVKPLIDDAIENAGGTGWRDAVDEYAKGMHGVKQQEMSARALELYNKSPQKFIDLAEGNAPKEVSDIFGHGNVDLAEQMAGKEAAIKDVAGQLSRDVKLADRAGKGSTALSKMVNHAAGQPPKINMLERTAAMFNSISDVIHGKANERTIKYVAGVMRDPKMVAKILKEATPAQINKFKELARQYKGAGIGATVSVTQE